MSTLTKLQHALALAAKQCWGPLGKPLRELGDKYPPVYAVLTKKITEELPRVLLPLLDTWVRNLHTYSESIAALQVLYGDTSKLQMELAAQLAGELLDPLADLGKEEDFLSCALQDRAAQSLADHRCSYQLILMLIENVNLNAAIQWSESSSRPLRRWACSLMQTLSRVVSLAAESERGSLASILVIDARLTLLLMHNNLRSLAFSRKASKLGLRSSDKKQSNRIDFRDGTNEAIHKLVVFYLRALESLSSSIEDDALISFCNVIRSLLKVDKIDS